MMTMRERIISKKDIICLAIMVSFLSAGMNEISETWKPLNISVCIIQGDEDDKGPYHCFKSLYNHTQGRESIDVKKHLSTSNADLEEIKCQVTLICLSSSCDRAPPSFC